MSGLTDRSALSLTSVGGDVTLVGQTEVSVEGPHLSHRPG